MPIYEFRCDGCGAELEALVGAGTQATECPECAAPARRVYSPPSRPLRLVKPPREARKQERRNAQLRASTKARFRERRARRRAKASDGGAPSGGADA